MIYIFWLPHWFTASDYPFDLQLLITPLIYSFWLPLWFTASDYPLYDIFKLYTLYLDWLCDDAFLYDEYQLRVHVVRHFPLLWNVTVAVCCIRMISTIKSLLTWSAFVFNFNQHTYDTLLQILRFHIWRNWQNCAKKNLKILKGWPESVNRRMTDDPMAKTKRRKGRTTIYKILHRKLTPQKRGWTQMPQQGKDFLLH